MSSIPPSNQDDWTENYCHYHADGCDEKLRENVKKFIEEHDPERLDEVEKYLKYHRGWDYDLSDEALFKALCHDFGVDKEKFDNPYKGAEAEEKARRARVRKHLNDFFEEFPSENPNDGTWYADNWWKVYIVGSGSYPPKRWSEQEIFEHIYKYFCSTFTGKKGEKRGKDKRKAKRWIIREIYGIDPDEIFGRPPKRTTIPSVPPSAGEIPPNADLPSLKDSAPESQQDKPKKKQGFFQRLKYLVFLEWLRADIPIPSDEPEPPSLLPFDPFDELLESMPPLFKPIDSDGDGADDRAPYDPGEHDPTLDDLESSKYPKADEPPPFESQDDFPSPRQKPLKEVPDKADMNADDSSSTDPPSSSESAQAPPPPPIYVSSGRSGLFSQVVLATVVIAIIVSSAVSNTEEIYDPMMPDGSEATIKGDLDGDSEDETVTEAPDLAGKKYEVTDDDGDGDKDSVRVGGKPVGKGDLYGNGRDVIIVETPAEPLGGFTGLDLDGDGKFDIIFVPEGSFLDIFDVDGNGKDDVVLDSDKGGQTGQTELPGGGKVFWISNTISHNDFDGDGMLNSEEISYGTDVFTMEVDIDGDGEMETAEQDPEMGPSEATATDTDGDGDKDEVKFGGTGVGTVLWAGSDAIVVESEDEPPGGYTAVDLDGDGTIDIVYVPEGDFIEIADTDGDGKGDTVFLDAVDDVLSWKDHDNDGKIEVFFVPRSDLIYIICADLSGDGEPDYIFLDDSLDEKETIQIDIDGDGDFDVYQFPDGDLLKIEDIDGDGDMEVVLKGGWGVKDIDGDGDIDIVWIDDDQDPDDADGDGWSNEKEREEGTDPLDPTSFPTDGTPDHTDSDGDRVFGNHDLCDEEDSTGYDANADGCLDVRKVEISVSSGGDIIEDNIVVIIRDANGRVVWRSDSGTVANLQPGTYSTEVDMTLLTRPVQVQADSFTISEGENVRLEITVATAIVPLKYLSMLVDGVASFIFASLASTLVHVANGSMYGGNYTGTFVGRGVRGVAFATTFGVSMYGLSMLG